MQQIKTGEKITGKIIEQDYSNILFDELLITRTKISKTTFKNIQFKNSQLGNDSEYNDCEFIECKFLGKYSTLGLSTKYHNCRFVDCEFNGVTLFEGSKFYNCIISGVIKNAIIRDSKTRLLGRKTAVCIGSIVERKTRFTFLIKLENKKSETVCKAFSHRLSMLPEVYRKTLTYDNGTEMAQHKELKEKTGMEVYFAHPYSSWERGTNENTNAIVRRFFPKKTDFNQVGSVELFELQNRLNNRPRKVLGYYTPKERFFIEMSTKAADNVDLVLKTGNKSHKDLFSFLIPQRK